MASWQERLKALIGPNGYDPCMRRSLQTIILYEAKRATDPLLKTLKPYQRKAAFLAQCHFLLDSLDFVFPNQKDDVMLRTMTSRAPIDDQVAWARLKGINKQLGVLSDQIKPFLDPNRSHNEAVDMLVQSLFEGKDGSNRGKTFPWTWEHAHNHVIMAYRLYYKRDELDPDFPPPIVCPDADMHLPQEPPKRETRGRPPTRARPQAGKAMPHEADEPALDVAAILGETDKPAQDRRRQLQEVRQHLDLLKEFEGVISEEEIARRKRELFLSLPPAPPAKKAKV